MWDEMTEAVKAWKLLNNFNPHFIMGVITYQLWNYSYSMFLKGPHVSFCEIIMNEE